MIIFLVTLIFSLMSVKIIYAQVSTQWVQRFTSDSVRNEYVNDMFVDSQGNVYVTGSQRYRPFPYEADVEAVTIKYNSLGEQQWIQNYHAADNNGAIARALYVDAAGNVYVTGESAIYSGGSNRALVIKYSPNGSQLWSYLFAYNSAYNSGFDIVADLEGNVYVTGEYYTGATFANNIFCAKFSSGGALINQTFYNSGSEGGRRIGLDGSGKVIITGYLNDNDSLSFIALKYEQNLDFVWATRYGRGIGNANIIDMSLDINSNIIIAGTNSITIDYLTVKINPAGIAQWGKQYSSADGWDRFRAVSCDNIGNVYVTGQTGVDGFPLTNKFTTLKYAPDGNQLWIKSYNGGTSPDGYSPYGINVDDSANVYITGQVYSTSDISTVKYDIMGELKWAVTYNGIGNSADIGIAVGIDASGNTYTSGNSIGSNSGNDIVIIKYSPSSIGIQNISTEFPKEFYLHQNYPNPFNPFTKIKFDITNQISGNLILSVYDINGKEVDRLFGGKLQPGTYETYWNASKYPSGIYFCKLSSDNFSEKKKMMLIK